MPWRLVIKLLMAVLLMPVLPIPLVVHQLWTAGGDPPDPILRNAVDAWRAQPDVVHILWNDTSALHILRRHSTFAAEAYLSMPPQQKKDLFMYIVLAEIGGLFVDCDVQPLRAAAVWLRQASLRGDDVVVGLEAYGTAAEKHAFRWGDEAQLAAWAVASKPQVSLLREAANDVIKAYQTDRLSSTYMDSIMRTGPGLLTKKVKGFLAERGKVMEDLRSVSNSSDNDGVNGIRVLGINAFGCGQRHSGSRSCEDVSTDALVQHHFAGSWKWDLCANESSFAFQAMARWRGWHTEAWFPELQQRIVWNACGVKH